MYFSHHLRVQRNTLVPHIETNTKLHQCCNKSPVMSGLFYVFVLIFHRVSWLMRQWHTLKPRVYSSPLIIPSTCCTSTVLLKHVQQTYAQILDLNNFFNSELSCKDVTTAFNTIRTKYMTTEVSFDLV